MNINQKLTALQNELKAPKTQLNKQFGRYYRNQEDILEAVKPLLKKYELSLTISDEVVCIGLRFYVKANVHLIDSESSTILVTAYAREEEEKRGMDSSQITGSASSYARKYALNGLFLIDDTRDADSMDNSSKEVKKTPVIAPAMPSKPSEGATAIVGKCEKFSTPINTAVKLYSVKTYGKSLCRKCQESEK